jgi:hypothetical protein
MVVWSVKHKIKSSPSSNSYWNTTLPQHWRACKHLATSSAVTGGFRKCLPYWRVFLFKVKTDAGLSFALVTFKLLIDWCKSEEKKHWGRLNKHFCVFLASTQEIYGLPLCFKTFFHTYFLRIYLMSYIDNFFPNLMIELIPSFAARV